MPSPLLPAQQPTPDPRLHELVAGQVYAHLQPRGGWCVSNAGVLAGPDGVTLIDCTATPRSAARLRAQIASRTQLPITRLVISHHHGDHHYGASAFPEATVIAHEHTRSAILRDGLNLTQIWPDAGWGQLELTVPQVTFTDRLTLHLGSLPVELIHFGPAHTTGDIVAWLPEHRILFAGDLVFSQATPFVFMGSVKGSLRVLEQLRALDPQAIVSGHGPIAGVEVIDENLAYLRWIDHLAAEGLAAGWSPLETAQRSDLGPYRDLPEAERIVGNLHRAYAEHTGQPLGAELPIGPPLGDMVAFNGGRPMPCTV
ncbi:MBL fold metallo-hydrolase [Streptomyces sp. NBC_01304]|uniref:MBL fold metallo-hydrolase n=1 Tax=Streptomyces sp. NBC_01304 TaxID=2903818 RepID=UPI002E108F34|nr:MBL fold metallo-hydrolase [Streptomyces sp. NBC_01304]